VTGSFIQELALIFTGASILATLFLYLRQPIILAYIGLGIAIGPWGTGVIRDLEHVEIIAHLGIVLLMFLLGLHLHPNKLVELLRETALVTLGTSVAFVALTVPVGLAFGFPAASAVMIGVALMFSSTVIGLKLIPTTSLHHRRIGELMISVLLFQDFLAIAFLLYLGLGGSGGLVAGLLLLLLKTALLGGASLACVRFLLLRAMRRFEKVQDYIFLMSLGWCFLGAYAARSLGLSYEIGAFLAGIALATSPVALVIAEGLKPVREFFLILFFFAIGAGLDLGLAREVALPALVIAFLLLAAKPALFALAFRLGGEAAPLRNELGFRLGQASEFSLLAAYAAAASGRLEPAASTVIQVAAIVTFVASTYLVVNRYPTPIAADDAKRLD